MSRGRGFAKNLIHFVLQVVERNSCSCTEMVVETLLRMIVNVGGVGAPSPPERASMTKGSNLLVKLLASNGSHSMLVNWEKEKIESENGCVIQFLYQRTDEC